MSKRLSVAFLASVLVVLAASSSALGASVTKTLDFPLSGSSTTTIFHKDFECCTIDVPELDVHGSISGFVDFKMDATMNEPTHNDLAFTDTNLRQGRTLDLKNNFTNDPGSLDIDYVFSGGLSAYGIGFTLNKSQGVSVSCQIPLLTGTCSKDSNFNILTWKPIDLLAGYVAVKVDAVITTTADLNTNGSNGISSHRTLTVDTADVKPPTDLHFTSSPQQVDESVKLSCALPTNSVVNYAMGDEAGTVDGTVTEGIGIGISGGAYLFNPVPDSDDILLIGVGPFNLPGLVDLPSLEISTIHLAAPAKNVDLGTLLPNNIAPTVALDGTFSGTEGSPLTLKVKGTGPGGSMSPCGDDSLDIAWSFDDGGTAFGKSVNHAWADNLMGNVDRSGKVVVTDPTGLKTTLNLNASVSNVAPSVGAGPAKTTVWGVPVSFHGNGSDAGPVDAASLLYSWDFGDPDSLIGAAGQDVTHAYANPGDRTAQVTVTDHDGLSGNATVSVTVTKRASTTGYTGATSFVVTDAATLRAALTDNTSSGPVAGRAVDFYDGSMKIASGTTGNNGVATATFAFALGSVGSHTITAKFAGDSLYTSSDSPATSVSVTVNAAALAYTGVLSSSPSKPLTMTAKLTDDLGRPLSSKLVNFSIGTQSCSGTTTANGTVSCTIAKLTQKPGKYPLTVQYAGDPNYAAAAVNTIFTINQK